MLSRIFYNIGIQLFLLGVRAKSLTDAKARQWLRGRKGLFLEMNRAIVPKQGARIWIHCSSLGEFEQGRPLIEQLKAQRPELEMVLTFFSPSGYEVRKDYEKADYIFYLPLDTPKMHNASCPLYSQTWPCL